MMNPGLIYLLKVSMAISLLTIPYYLLLRNDPQLVVKRMYLSVGIVLAWIFPLLVVSKPQIASAFEPTFFIDPGTAGTSPVSGTLPQETAGRISPTLVLGLAYLAGIIILFFKNITSYYKAKMYRSTELSGIKNVHITNNDQVYTIFPSIFLPKKYSDNSDLDSILIHERAHIRQLHFIDLLLSELTLLLTWFNPFSWLISRMIKENHEHLADRSVLQQGVNPARYKALLLNHAMGGEVFRLGHQFNHSLTKKRFIMMKKVKAPRKGFLKYMIIVPVILGFTLVATATAQKPKTINGKVYLENTDEPAIGASVVIAGGTKGCVADLSGEFALEVEGNPEIVISFVGYKNVRKTAKEIISGPVIMIPTAYTINMDNIEPKEDSKGGTNIIIRSEDGTTKEPVYLVNGEKVNSIDDIDPDDIESVNVIKDPENALIKKYKAENGIVQITTKKIKTISSKQEVKDSDQEVFYIVEDIPSFPGGKAALRDYITSHQVYPEKAKKNNTAGEVLVQFKVTNKGMLENIKVNQSSNDIFNEAALNIFKDMPAWKPGAQRGKPVNANVIVPVRFDPSME